MKLANIFTILSAYLCIISSFTTQISLNFSIDNQKLSKSICEITNDVTSSKSDTQDILIGDLTRNVKSSIVSDIVNCISDKSAVIVTDFRVQMMELGLRQAAIIILVMDNLDGLLISKLINDHQQSTVFHHMAKIICIAPTSSTLNQRIIALKFFLRFDFLNVAIAHESTSGDIIYEIVVSLSKSQGRMLKNPNNSALVFPDKLRNMEGFPYKVPIYYQPPIVEVINGRIYSPMMFYLSVIGSTQNAKFDLIFLQNSSHFIQYWENREMHLTINTAIAMRHHATKILTYDKKSYCALVPIPPNASLFSVIFVKPFDGLIWMLFALSIASSAAVWRLYHDRGAVDSHWQLMFGIFTIFIGQGAEFSRNNCFVIGVLLNIISFNVFLLSNLYEGAITSYMIEPAHEYWMKTVEDILASDYTFTASPLFETTMRNSSLVNVMSSRLNSSGFLMGADDGRHVIDQEFIFIRTCDVAKRTLSGKLQNDRYVSDYYYLLPEELSWQYIQLEASYANPFVDRFQYFMDLCFQAGLPQMWKVMASQDYSEFKTKPTEDEREYLELQDLGSVFGVLIIGLALSALILLVEIFHYGCLRSLNISLIASKMWNRMRKVCLRESKKNNPKVRKINVRPSRCT